MDGLQLKLCDIQGRLFELSGANGYDSVTFVKAFMTGDVAKGLDSKFNRMQWAGEEYLLEELVDVAGDKLSKEGELFSKDILYWMGYLYRYWHYYKNESSKNIYKIAPFKTMNINYLMFHTFSVEHAIEQAKTYGHSLQREIGFLTVHSMLHLLGYDHEKSEEEDREMRSKQTEIMRIMGLEVK